MDHQTGYADPKYQQGDFANGEHNPLSFGVWMGVVERSVRDTSDGRLGVRNLVPCPYITSWQDGLQPIEMLEVIAKLDVVFQGMHAAPQGRQITSPSSSAGASL
jgi:hypothetical protein